MVAAAGSGAATTNRRRRRASSGSAYGAEALSAKKILIDTSSFFGATHLAWMAAEALIVPVRVDQSSLEALDLTLRMIGDIRMGFGRTRRRPA